MVLLKKNKTKHVTLHLPPYLNFEQNGNIDLFFLYIYYLRSLAIKRH